MLIFYKFITVYNLHLLFIELIKVFVTPGATHNMSKLQYYLFISFLNYIPQFLLLYSKFCIFFVFRFSFFIKLPNYPPTLIFYQSHFQWFRPLIFAVSSLSYLSFKFHVRVAAKPDFCLISHIIE